VTTICNALQHTAARCNTYTSVNDPCLCCDHTLHHLALHCNILLHTAPHVTHCTTLQFTTVHCTTVHHSTPRCTTLHHNATHVPLCRTPVALEIHIAQQCTMLHHSATLCTTLQHTATHGNTLTLVNDSSCAAMQHATERHLAMC